jgi:hypothetical protein
MTTRYRHFTLAQYEAKVEARFWSKVNKTETCWLWTGHESQKGYGLYTFTVYPNGRSIAGATSKEVRAHRYAWEKTNGPIPEWAELDHTCHTPLCVRPSHLRPATRKQNSENQRQESGRAKSGVRGVHWSEQKKKWRAVVVHNGKPHYAGYFSTVEEASIAVVAKRNELHTFNIQDRIS